MYLRISKYTYFTIKEEVKIYMAEITFDGLNENSLIMQWNTDNYGNPKSIHINNEIQQVSPTHNVIQLAQIPDEYYMIKTRNHFLLRTAGIIILKAANCFSAHQCSAKG